MFELVSDPEDSPEVWQSHDVPGLCYQDSSKWGHVFFAIHAKGSNGVPAMELLGTMSLDVIEDRMRAAIVAAVEATLRAQDQAHRAWAEQPDHDQWADEARQVGEQIGLEWFIRWRHYPDEAFIRTEVAAKSVSLPNLGDGEPDLADVWIEIASREAIRVIDARRQEESGDRNDDFE